MNWFYSFAMVLDAGFLLLVSLVMNVWIAAVGTPVHDDSSYSLFLFLFIAALFAALHRTLFDVSRGRGDVARAAALTSLLFLVGKRSSDCTSPWRALGSMYGTDGAPLVVLLSVYDSAQLFLSGAEFSKLYMKTWGSQSARRDPLARHSHGQ